MNGISDTDYILDEAGRLGFGDNGLISFTRFQATISTYADAHLRIDVSPVISALKKGVPECEDGSFLVCALPYASGVEAGRLPPSLFGDIGPFMRIAPFAARHYYRAAVEKLKILRKKLLEHLQLSKKDFRIFCNSGIPEKLLALAAGIGNYGKNQLIINEKYGTRFIIAVLFIRKELPLSPIMKKPAHPCENCSECINTCQVKALSGDRGLDVTRCLQARATKNEKWDDSIKKIWGQRLYGCEICQQVCPHNKKISVNTDIFTGYLGEKISISGFLKGTEEEIKQKLKGSALGMSWIPVPALLRNALVAAGNSDTGTEELELIVETYVHHHDPIVRKTAIDALKKIRLRFDEN